MNKKSVSATLLILFMAVLFSIIGVSFYIFVYDKTRILVKKVGVVYDSNIVVYSDKKLTKKASALKLSNMDIGLKPATGEVDSEMQVPSTIDDKGTSEGYYSTVYVKTTKSFKVILKNIKIESDKDEILVKEQRKNIFISIKDLKNSVKSLENEDNEIARFEDVSDVQKITFLIWLGSFASDDLEGARIYFDIAFVLI